MKDWIQVIEHFLLDIGGTMLPGAGLLFGIDLIVKFENCKFPSSFLYKELSNNCRIVLLLATIYALGHLVRSLGIPVIKFWAYFEMLKGWLTKKIKKVSTSKMSQSTDDRKVENNNPQNRFKFEWERQTKLIISDRELRNIAMSLTPENDPKIFRFTFLANLNLGLAVDIILVCFIWMIFSMLSVKGANYFQVVEFDWFIFILLLMCSYAFFERYIRFNSITKRIPFSIALVSLLRSPIKRSSNE